MVPTFKSTLFKWFTAHGPAAVCTFSALKLPVKRGAAPYELIVTGPDSATRKFRHQYDMQNSSTEALEPHLREFPLERHSLEALCGEFTEALEPHLREFPHRNHRYDMQNLSTEAYKAKYVAVYWHVGTEDSKTYTTAYIYYC